MAVSFVFLLVSGGIVAFALTRSLALAVPLSVPVTLVVSSVGAVLGTTFGISIVGCNITITLIGIAVASAVIAIRYRRGQIDRRACDGVAVMVWFAVPATALLAHIRPIPIAWDARSIWWLHASWFLRGGSASRRGIATPALAFSHPDYPPGDPSAIATLWHVTDRGFDMWLAQTFTAVATALAITGLALLLVRGSRDPVRVTAATALVTSVAFLGQGLAAAGYVDVLCAALLVSALVAFVRLPHRPTAIAAGSVLLAGATVTKNEGVAVGIIVAAIALCFVRRPRIAQAFASAAAFIPVVLWQIAVSSTGAHLKNDVGSGLLIDSLGASRRDRLFTSLDAVLDANWLVVSAALAAFLILVLVRIITHRSTRDEGELKLAAALIAASVASGVVMAFVYAMGRFELDWWFKTSLERVSSTIRMFALASMVPMVALAARHLRSLGTRLSDPDHPGRHSDPSAGAALRSPTGSPSQAPALEH